jgi:cellobiose dehydrogenase (acceptor)
MQVQNPDSTKPVIQATFEDVGFAQGKSGSTNNWWFGGKNCVHSSNYTVRCAGKDAQGHSVHFYFSRGGDDNIATVWLSGIDLY